MKILSSEKTGICFRCTKLAPTDNQDDKYCGELHHELFGNQDRVLKYCRDKKFEAVTDIEELKCNTNEN